MIQSSEQVVVNLRVGGGEKEYPSYLPKAFKKAKFMFMGQQRNTGKETDHFLHIEDNDDDYNKEGNDMPFFILNFLLSPTETN